MPADDATPLRQGSSDSWSDRMPLPPMEALDAPQRAAAQALLEGPRKGIYGPFLPLLRSPELLDRVAKLGEYLRFDSVLDARVRELATCVVARHLSNQFEWRMHAPLALKAGVSTDTLEALRIGARPAAASPVEAAAFDFASSLLATHGVPEPVWRAAVEQLGDRGVVELATLVGYFAMVSWLMNACHTPAQAGSTAAPLPPFPL